MLALFLIESVFVAARARFLASSVLPEQILGSFGTFEILAFLIALYPLYNILKVIGRLSGKFAHAFHFGAARHESIRSRMIEDFFFFAFSLLLALSTPFLLSVLHLPDILHELFLLPLAVALLFLLDLARQATRMLAPHGEDYHKIPGYKGKK